MSRKGLPRPLPGPIYKAPSSGTKLTGYYPRPQDQLSLPNVKADEGTYHAPRVGVNTTRWRCLDSNFFPTYKCLLARSTPMVRGVLWPSKQSKTRLFTSHGDRVVTEAHPDQSSLYYLSAHSVHSLRHHLFQHLLPQREPRANMTCGLLSHCIDLFLQAGTSVILFFRDTVGVLYQPRPEVRCTSALFGLSGLGSTPASDVKPPVFLPFSWADRKVGDSLNIEWRSRLFFSS